MELIQSEPHTISTGTSTPIDHCGSLPLLGLIAMLGIGLAFALPVVRSSFGGAWWHVLLVIAGELVLLAAVVTVVLLTLEWLRRVPPRCPKCDGEWRSGPSGFCCFALTPMVDDVLIALFFGLAHFAIFTWIGP